MVPPPPIVVTSTPVTKSPKSRKNHLGSGNSRPSRHQNRPTTPPHGKLDCLEESITLIQDSMDHASGGNTQEKGWFKSLVEQIEEKHKKEKSVLEKNLDQAERKKRGYKRELKDSLLSRLNFLEEKLSETSTASATSTTQTPSITRNSTATTHGSSSDGDDVGLNVNHFGPPVGIEVAYDESRVQQLQQELKKQINQHEKDRLEWVTALEQVANVTAKGQHLSAQQESQLMQIAKEHQRQRQQAREKTKVLQQLLDLTEEQHNMELKKLHEETSKVRADFEKAQSEWRNEKETMERETQSVRDQAERDREFLNERVKGLEETIKKLESDKDELESQATTAKKQAARLQENMKSFLGNESSGGRSSPRRPEMRFPPPSPRRRADMEEKLDRAIAERDMFQQEAKHATEQLKSIKEDHQQSVKAIEDEFKEILREKEEKLKNEAWLREVEIKAETEEQIRLMERRLKDVDQARRLSDNELVQKYRDSIDKRNDLVARLRKMEQQHTHDKGSWKLQLEATLAERRLLAEEKSQLEADLAQLKSKYDEEVSNLNSKLEATKTELDKQISELKALNSSESKKAKKELQLATSKVKTLEQKLKAVEEDSKGKINQAFDDRAKDATRWNEKLRAAQAEKEDWKDQYHACAAEMKQKLEEQRLSFEAEMKKKLEEKNGQSEEEMKLKFDELAASHLKEIENLRKELEAVQTESDEWKEVVQVTEEDTRRKLAALEAQHSKEVEEWQTKFVDLQKESEERIRHVREEQSKQESELRRRARHSEERLEALVEIQVTKEKELRMQARESIEQLESMKQAHATQENQWRRQSLEAKREKEQVEDLKEKHARESQEWKSMLQSAIEENNKLTDRCRELSRKLEEMKEVNTSREEWQTKIENLTRERDECRRTLESFRTEASSSHRELSRERDELKMLLEALQNDVSQINQTNSKERDRLKAKLDALQAEATQLDIKQYTRHVEKNQKMVLQVVDDLRKDVMSIRETFEASAKTSQVLEEANLNEFRSSFEEIQNALNDAVAELTLESEAMLESRNTLKTLADQVSASVNASRDKTLEMDLDQTMQQSRDDLLMSQVAELRDQISRIADNAANQQAHLQDSVRLQLLNELQKREITFAACQAELEQCKQRLSNEIILREKAEGEVATLNDQADAYSEELMRLHAVNAGLEETLRDAERKMEEALIRDKNVGSSLIPNPSRLSGSSDGDDEASQMLDEALALAQGLTDIVHGRGNYQKESTVMEMLETLSELMDKHDRGELAPEKPPLPSDKSSDVVDDVPIVAPIPRRSFVFPPNFAEMNAAAAMECEHVESPRHRHELHDGEYGIEVIQRCGSAGRVGVEAGSESPPRPVATPLPSDRQTTSSVELVVEQLYARCQMLERERMEMMETTLDLLESAREANSAELEAALATARRRASEEIDRMRQKNQVDQERIFHKLCRRCLTGLLSEK